MVVFQDAATRVHPVELYATAKMSVDGETGMRTDVIFLLMNHLEYVLTIFLSKQKHLCGVHHSRFYVPTR